MLEFFSFSLFLLSVEIVFSLFLKRKVEILDHKSTISKRLPDENKLH